jgi:ABC-type sugar transport system ATPase subunit
MTGTHTMRGRVDVAELVLDGVWRFHDDGTEAVAGVHLRVGPGEIVALVGPSGSGKTTLVRLVAGLEPVSDGDVLVDGRPITRLLPRERDVALVTQQGSLHPRRTAAESIDYPLKLRHLSPAERADRVAAETRVLHLEGLLDRLPGKLSAGQRRLAELAKAIARSPKAFLLDEPLAGIDAPERARIRAELAALLRGLGVPTLWVTGDRDEAMAVGDRLAVLRAGRLVQVGAPRTLYERPAGLFVATFLGQAGLLRARVEVGARTAWLNLGHDFGGVVVRLRLDGPGQGRRGLVGRDLVALARPEQVRRPTPGEDGPTLPAEVLELERRGAETLVRCAVELPAVTVPGERGRPAGGRAELVARLPAFSRLGQGERIELEVDADALSLFDAGSGAAVWHQDPAA